MAVTDYDSLLVARLWEILDTGDVRAAIYDRGQLNVGRKLNQSTPEGVARSLMDRAGPGDFPRIQIEPGDFGHAPFTTDPAFAEEEQGFVSGGGRWPAVHTTEVLILLYTRGMTAPEQTAMDWAVLKALLSNGPRLGLPWLTRWEARGTRQRLRQTDADAVGQARRKTTIRVRGQVEFEGADFVA